MNIRLHMISVKCTIISILFHFLEQKPKLYLMQKRFLQINKIFFKQQKILKVKLCTNRIHKYYVHIQVCVDIRYSRRDFVIYMLTFQLSGKFSCLT